MPKALSVSLQLSLGTIVCFSASPILAQVTSDGTVNTQVNQSENVFVITGGETREGNLFHSFQDFSVPTGDVAFFNNLNNISNIFSRVTGGNISNIDGIVAANGNANLFLINPAGIIFGENARLDIGGSFYGSTANSILFEDAQFSATELENSPLLTVNAPIGLGFRDNPGDIVNRSIATRTEPDPFFESLITRQVGLDVVGGNVFALIGGNVFLDGGIINILEGNIEIGGVAERGVVSINENGTLSFPEDINKANTTLTDSSVISTETTFQSDGDSGNISLKTGNLTISNNSKITTLAAGDGNAGLVNISATESVNLTDSSVISTELTFQSDGDGGNISLETGNLTIGNNSGILTSLSGDADFDSGSLSVVSDDAIILNNFSFISSDIPLQAQGNSGGISLETGILNLNQNSRISASTSGGGNAGSVIISAKDSIKLDENSSILSATGLIQSNNNDTITIINGNDADTISDIGEFDVVVDTEGNIILDSGDRFIVGNIQDDITIIDGEGNIVFGDGNNQNFNGNGSDILITSPFISLKNGSQINVSVINNEITQGDSGNIQILASNGVDIIGNMTEENTSGLFANTEINSLGDAGNIFIYTGEFNISNNGTINVNSLGQGNGGNIGIKSNSLELNNNASILSTSVSGLGGNADIQIEGNLILRNNSNITAGAFEEAIGGNISIDSSFIIAFPSETPVNGNDIIAEAGQGGGSVNIFAQDVFGMSIRQAVPGNRTNDISAANTTEVLNLSPQIVTELQTPPQIIDSQQTTKQACEANREALAEGGLNIIGKGGIVPDPKQPLNSLNLYPKTESTPVSTIPAPIKTSKGKIQPARGVKRTESGDIILTAYRTSNSGDRIPEKRNCG